jgi:hypothetical protein
LLDFIEVVTFFFQHQREKIINEQTGEFYIQTTPEDVKLAFSLLKNSLLRKADELSTSARGFYNWLKKFLLEAKTRQFTALDIRKAKPIHPRTLNRYLQELTLFNYIQITGGNKHRGGFIYKTTNLNELSGLQNNIETSLQNTLLRINETQQQHAAQQIVEQTQVEAVEEPTEQQLPTRTILTERSRKRVRIEEREEYTLKFILELEQEQKKP